MNRRPLLLALGLILSNLAAAPITLADGPADEPTVLRDAGQHELRLEHPPRRIITLLPSLTETVCALHECARLIATDRYSNWPDSVKALPKTGGLDDPQIELIVSLKPDVVILAHAPRVTDRLRELGVPTFVVETHTYADISGTVSAIGQLLAVPDEAASLNRDIESSVAAVAASARRGLQGRSPLFYYEVDSGPYGAGPESFIGEMLARLGARNILTPDLGPFPKLNPEYVVRHNPDVIFVSPQEAPNLDHRPGWDQIRAVREKRICSFAPQVRDTIVRAGPRVADGLKAMADCLERVAP
jgi:cobalamin transport system substrate-binding protein